MELMSSLTSIFDKAVPKLIEFPEHYVLNTQLYDKQTLKPIPMKFYVNNDLNNPFMLLQTSIDKTKFYYSGYFRNPQHNYEENKQHLIQDKNDPSIFYAMMLKSSGSAEAQYLCKMQYNSDTKKYTILDCAGTDSGINSSIGYFNGLSTDSYGSMKIIADLDEYFVLSVMAHGYSYTLSDYYNYNMSGIVLLNKSNFEYTTIAGKKTNAYPYHLIKINNDCLYMLTYTTSQSYKKLIEKINISSKSVTTLWTESNSSTTGVICNPVCIDDSYYVLSFYLENNIYTYKMMKIHIDFTTDTVNTELLDINLNGFIIDNILPGHRNYGQVADYALKVIRTDSNIYLSCLIHGSPNNDTTSYEYQHKHILFKFNGTSFTVVDMIPLTDGLVSLSDYYLKVAHI